MRDFLKRSSTTTGVLLGAGSDSAGLILVLLREGHSVLPIYVRCGFFWESAELFWLRRLLRTFPAKRVLPLKLVTMPVHSLYGNHWSLTGKGSPKAASPDSAVFLPGRNALLLTAAAIVAAPERVSQLALGILRSNPFGDATPQFFRHMASALGSALETRFQIVAPFRRLAKKQLIEQFPKASFALTFSCIQPKLRYHHCGRCNKCAERKKAFRQANVADPTKYIH